jgi:hypothetical protein
MGIFETIERIRFTHELIQSETTGTPNEFANRLHIKRRRLYDILNEFRDYGAEIKYDRIKRTYYYANDVDISFKITATTNKND